MADTLGPLPDRLQREAKVKIAFTPHSPINRAEFFRGRIEQIRAVTDAVTSLGLHAIVYGERGVGKTSLANIIADLLGVVVVATARVQCSHGDTFTTVIRRALSALAFSSQQPGLGFNQPSTESTLNIIDLLRPEGDLLPDEVAQIMAMLPPFVVIVIDEFDRLTNDATAAFADLIKALSDRGASTTVLLVGVAEDVNGLIASHASVERCVRQIRLPRMSEVEITEILVKGLEQVELDMDPIGMARIVTVAQGFPQYAHLLGQYASRAALDADASVVTETLVLEGMNDAVQHSDQSLREAYFKAVTGTKKQNLWKHVVAACALAESDERGYFSSRAVQDQLSALLGREVIQQTVAFHLGKLIEPSRGPMLERVGPERRYRYRFINPLMAPFVLMKWTSEKHD